MPNAGSKPPKPFTSKKYQLTSFFMQLPQFNTLARPYTEDLLSATTLKLTKAKPKPSEDQYKRLLLAQVLITMLEDNIRIAIREGVWPGKADKLATALHARIDELYERIYKHTGTAAAEWVLQVARIMESATIPLLNLAIEGNPENIPIMSGAIKALARQARMLEMDLQPIEAADLPGRRQLDLFEPAPDMFAAAQVLADQLACSEGCADASGRPACQACPFPGIQLVSLVTL